MKEWEAEQQEIAEARQAGTIKKAFVVAGNGEGNFVEIIPTVKGAAKAGEAVSDTANEIAGILEREKRNKELDGEKVWQKIRESVVGKDGELMKRSGDLSQTEYYALYVAIYQSLQYKERQYFDHEVLKLDRSEHSGVKLAERLGNITIEQRHILRRLLIGQQLFPHEGSHERSHDAYWGKLVAEDYNRELVEQLEAEQNAVAEKRAAKKKQSNGKK